MSCEMEEIYTNFTKLLLKVKLNKSSPSSPIKTFSHQKLSPWFHIGPDLPIVFGKCSSIVSLQRRNNYKPHTASKTNVATIEHTHLAEK